MTCFDPCSKEQEILDRLATLENALRNYVQTVNGVYGPFVLIDIPDISDINNNIKQNTSDIDALEVKTDQTNEDIAGLTFVKNLEDYTATIESLTQRVMMRDGTIASKVLPVVSALQMGAMTPSGYQQIWTNRDLINGLLNNSAIADGDLGGTTVQAEITAFNEGFRSRTSIDGDRVLDTSTVLLWIYASGTWYPLSESATPQATNTSLGTVKGSSVPGQFQVELDGTCSVNNWDYETGRLSDVITSDGLKLPKTGGTMTGVLTMDLAFLKARYNPDSANKFWDLEVYKTTNERVYIQRMGNGTVNNFLEMSVFNPSGTLNSSIFLKRDDSEGWVVIPTRASPGADDAVAYGQLSTLLTTKQNKNISVSNVSILSTDWIANVDSADLVSKGYLYQYTIPVTDMLATMIPEVMPSYNDRITGYLWGWAESVDGGVTIYSKSARSMTISWITGTVV